MCRNISLFNKIILPSLHSICLQVRLIKLEREQRKGKEQFWCFKGFVSSNFRLKQYLNYSFPEYKSVSTQANTPKEPKVDKGEA